MSGTNSHNRDRSIRVEATDDGFRVVAFYGCRLGAQESALTMREAEIVAERMLQEHKAVDVYWQGKNRRTF